MNGTNSNAGQEQVNAMVRENFDMWNRIRSNFTTWERETHGRFQSQNAELDQFRSRNVNRPIAQSGLTQTIQGTLTQLLDRVDRHRNSISNPEQFHPRDLIAELAAAHRELDELENTPQGRPAYMNESECRARLPGGALVPAYHRTRHEYPRFLSAKPQYTTPAIR